MLWHQFLCIFLLFFNHSLVLELHRGLRVTQELLLLIIWIISTLLAFNNGILSGWFVRSFVFIDRSRKLAFHQILDRLSSYNWETSSSLKLQSLNYTLQLSVLALMGQKTRIALLDKSYWLCDQSFRSGLCS